MAQGEGPANPSNNGGSDTSDIPGDRKVLNVDNEAQTPGSPNCAPASTRIALSARVPQDQWGNLPTEGQLASDEGTTSDGTGFGDQNKSPVRDTLNQHLPNDKNHTYQTKTLNTPDSEAQLWNDIIADIDNNYALVANIVAPPGKYPHYNNQGTIWHYFTIIGYWKSESSARIADPANFGGNSAYWSKISDLTPLVQQRGYFA